MSNFTFGSQNDTLRQTELRLQEESKEISQGLKRCAAEVIKFVRPKDRKAMMSRLKLGDPTESRGTPGKTGDGLKDHSMEAGESGGGSKVERASEARVNDVEDKDAVIQSLYNKLGELRLKNDDLLEQLRLDNEAIEEWIRLNCDLTEEHFGRLDRTFVKMVEELALRRFQIENLEATVDFHINGEETLDHHIDGEEAPDHHINGDPKKRMRK